MSESHFRDSCGREGEEAREGVGAREGVSDRGPGRKKEGTAGSSGDAQLGQGIETACAARAGLKNRGGHSMRGTYER